MFSKTEPLEKELLLYLETLHQDSFGRKLDWSKKIKNKSVLLLGLLPSDASLTILSSIRKKLYALFWGCWNISVLDLGNYRSTCYEEDKKFFKKLVESISETNSSVIFLGDRQPLNHHIIDLFATQKQHYNFSFINSQLMLDTPVCHQYSTFRNRLERDSKLFLTSSIGLQTYYNSVSDIAYANTHFYQVNRLGDILKSVDTVEPVLRESDVLFIDILKTVYPIAPVGIDVPSLCAMLRYAGMGCVQNFIFFQGLKENDVLFQAIALSIWYYIEGFTLRSLEDQNFIEQNFEKYLIASDIYEASFYRSLTTNRWWISLPDSKDEVVDLDLFFDKKNHLLVPCLQSVYEEFCHENESKRVSKLHKLIKKM